MVAASQIISRYEQIRNATDWAGLESSGDGYTVSEPLATLPMERTTNGRLWSIAPVGVHPDGATFYCNISKNINPSGTRDNEVVCMGWNVGSGLEAIMPGLGGI